MVGPTADADTAEAGGFGRVSRTVGTVFRYVLLLATLVGIAALAVLLLFVANDAIRPLTASATWLVVAGFALVVLPVGTAAALSRYRPAEFRFGLAATAMLFLALLYAGGAVIVFADLVPPIVWFSFCVAFAVPSLLAVALERIDRRVGFLGRLVAVGGIGVLSLWQLPPIVQSIPVLPSDWIILWLTIGGPAAGLAAWYVGGRFDGRLPPLIGALASFALVGVAGFAGVAAGIGGAGLVVATSVGVLPFLVYTGSALYDRGRAAVGLALPVVAVGGIVALFALERFAGLDGPSSWLNWGFLTTAVQSTDNPETVGIYAGIVGTILLMFLVAVFAFPIGVGAAVYLEEYAPDTRTTRIIDVNISNLAGVPSVVYGLLGLGLFVRVANLPSGTVIVGGMTLALLILPIVIISAREAIRSVPDTMREASYGMGATRWQTVRNVVLPEALPGILTGTILALGRAIGETAPLIVILAPTVFGVPDSLNDAVGSIPLQIYSWASAVPSEAFYTTVLAAGVLTIVVILLTMNSIAVILRNKYQRNS